MSPFNAFRKSLKVRRIGDVEYINGKPTEDASETLCIKGSVQPANTDDMQSLPEGRRLLGVLKIYTDTKLRAAREGSYNSDIIEIDGDDYEVAAVMPWQNGIINHYKILASRVQPA